MKCKQTKTDCFAYDIGECRALKDTRFYKPCPFYKTLEQYNKERKESKEEDHE